MHVQARMHTLWLVYLLAAAPASSRAAAAVGARTLLQQPTAAGVGPTAAAATAPPQDLDPMSSVQGQQISIEEQLQQAQALRVQLSQEDLEMAQPLLGMNGRLLKPPRTAVSDWPDGYFAICAIVKNQYSDLREWVEYHRYIGTNKIYIYDNNSTAPLAATISDFLHSGLVEYTYFQGRKRQRNLFRTSSQWWAYNDCIVRFAHRHRWLAFIDVDEFVLLHDTSLPDINAFLTEYEPFGGLALNWMIFGSSGHKTRPPGGVLINYTKCLPRAQVENNHVKVVANTAHLLTVGDDPHTVFYRTPEAMTVNEAKQPVHGAKTLEPSQGRIALYHYLTKSEAEYAEKMARGSAAGNFKSMGFFYAIDELANSTCTAAVPLGLKCCSSVHSDPETLRSAAARAGLVTTGALH